MCQVYRQGFWKSEGLALEKWGLWTSGASGKVGALKKWGLEKWGLCKLGLRKVEGWLWKSGGFGKVGSDKSEVVIAQVKSIQ